MAADKAGEESHMRKTVAVAAVLAPAVAVALAAVAADPLPPDATYRPLPTLPFSAVKKNDEAQKPKVLERQAALLAERYDLANRPLQGAMMSGGKRPCRRVCG